MRVSPLLPPPLSLVSTPSLAARVALALLLVTACALTACGPKLPRAPKGPPPEYEEPSAEPATPTPPPPAAAPAPGSLAAPTAPASPAAVDAG